MQPATFHDRFSVGDRQVGIDAPWLFIAVIGARLKFQRVSLNFSTCFRRPSSKVTLLDGILLKGCD